MALLAILLLLAIAAYCFVRYCVRPVVQTISKESIRAMTVETVNAAVAEVMENDAAYLELTSVERDADGQIVRVSANTATVNALARHVTERTQKSLEILAQDGIEIPIGSLSGMSFLAGRGPSVNIKAIPIGSVYTEFISEFKSAGINQTNHRLYLTVSSAVDIVLPGSSDKVYAKTQILVGENILIEIGRAHV